MTTLTGALQDAESVPHTSQLRQLAWETLIDFRVALRNVLRHRGRTILSLIAIVFGIAGLQVALGFTDWGLKDLREKFIRSQTGHLRITAPGFIEQGQIPIGKMLLPSVFPQADVVMRDPRIKGYAPRLNFTGLISVGEKTVSVIVDGVDAKAEARLGMQFDAVAGDSSTNGLQLGAGLARYLGAKVGDPITLVANTKSGGVNAIEMPLAAIYSTGNIESDNYGARIPIERAQKLLRVDGVHAWLLVLHDTDETDAVQSSLASPFPKQRFDIVHWSAQADFYKKMADLYAMYSRILKIIIAIIIIFGIGNTLSMAVLERTAEIGTTMAMGYGRARIMRQFLLEGVGLALLGAVIGVIVGCLASLALSAVGLEIPPLPGMTRNSIASVNITPGVIGAALAVAIPSVLVAAALPAWRASKQNIVYALRKAR